MTIVVLPISGSVNGNWVTLHPTLVQFNNKNYLIDCGYQETFGELVNQLEKQGVGVADLHAILISHDDIDHLGALKLFKEANPELLVYCSRVEADSVCGAVKSERLKQAEALVAQLPAEHNDWGLRFVDELQRIQRVRVDGQLADNDRIEEQLIVVATPGHTKGHLSFYAPAQLTLIASDAVVLVDGQLEIANPQFTLDLKQAVESVQKLLALPLNRLICYHGGALTVHIHRQLSTLVAKYST